MATPTPGLTPGQQSFYDALLIDDPEAAEDFKASILAEQERDAERARPAPVLEDDVFIQPDTPINTPETESSITDDNVQFAGPPSPIAPESFDEQQKSFYEDLYQDDIEAADEYLQGILAEKKRDAVIDVDETRLPDLPQTRSLPGFEFEGAQPPTPPSLKSLQENKDLIKAEQLIIPGLLDEEQRKGYDAAVVRYVSEGLPDEDALAGQFGIEFDQAYERKTGELPPKENAFDQASNKYMLDKLSFVREQVDKLPETAQDKAKEQFFGVKSPRKPRAVGQYEVEPTPVRPGMIQRNPQLADDMSLSELADSALSPQVITTADELRRQREPRRQAKKQLVDSLVAFGEENKLDPTDRAATEQSRIDFFTSYRDNVVDQIINARLGGTEGISPRFSPFFYGYSREEMEDLIESVTPEANAVTRQAIEITFRPIDTNNTGREGTQTSVEKELNKSFPIKENLGDIVNRQVIDPAVDFAVEGFTSLTTSKYDPEFRQNLFEQGIIENPDAITESAAMTVVRDVAGVLRLVVNPAISGAENLGLIDRKTPEEEVDTILPAARREYTEEVEFDIANPIDSMLDLGDAYLKEVLVETATMRSLGNDLGQLDSALFGMIDEDFGTSGMSDYLIPDAIVPSRNFIVGTGTLAEAFIPIGKGGAIRALGAPTRAVSKAPRAAKAAISQRTLRPTLTTPSKGVQAAERVGETALDIIAGGGNPLFATIKLASDYAPGIAKKAVVMGRAGTDVAKIARTIENGDIVASGFKGQKLSNIVSDTASVEGKVLNNLSDPIQALEIRARGGANALDDALQDGVIGGRAYAAVEQLTPAQAEKALQEIVTSETEVLSSMAERAMIGSERGTYNYEKALQRRRDIRGAGAEELTKYGLGDYVMLTDKTVVKSSWLDENIDAIDKALIDNNGKSKLFETQQTPTGQLEYFIKYDNIADDLIDIARNTGDGHLENLINFKDGMSIGDTIYVTNRYIDDIAMKGSDTAFVARKASTLEAAAQPLERRSAAIMGAKEVYNAFTPTSIKKVVDKGIKKVMNKPTVRQAQTAQTSATSARFANQVDEGIARLERTMKGAYGQTSRNLDATGVFDELSGTEFVGLSRLGINTALTYETVYRLQRNLNLSLADISKMTSDQLKNARAEYLSQRAASKMLANKDTFYNYLNTVYGTDLKSNDAIAALLARVEGRAQVAPFREANAIMKQIEQIAPQLKTNKVKNPADAIASMTANLETQMIVKRAIKETFAADEVATASHTVNERMRALAGYSIDISDITNIVEDLAALRYGPAKLSINTMSPAQIDLFYAKHSALPGAYSDYLAQSNKTALYPIGGTRNIVLNKQQFLAQLDGGSADAMADYLEVTALKRGITVKELRNNYGYQIRELTAPTKFQTIPGVNQMTAAVYPLTEAERKAIQQYTRTLGSSDAIAISDNFSKLQRNKDIFEYSTGMMNYMTNGMRRTFVSGQLGGKYLPNIPYQMENLLTAGLITYVTNPKYIMTVLGQTAQTPLGLTPYRKLRYMAAGSPDTMLPGTRFTYAQVYEEFTRRNLGVSNAGLNLGDSFYADLAQEASGWTRFTRGVPGYKELPDMLKNDKKSWLAGMLSYFRRGAQDVAVGTAEVVRPYSPTMSPYMKWADETDRAFREAIFVKALQNGESVESAAKLAREVMLDYGMMPPAARQGIMKSALYLSFTIASSAEMFKAMTTTNGALRVAAMASYHRDLNRYYGTYYSGGTRTLESAFMREVQDNEDGKIVNTYMRSPYLGNLINVGKLVSFTASQDSLVGFPFPGTGRTEDTVERVKEGLADFFYIPALDFITELDTDYKRGVSGKQMLQMQQRYYEMGFFNFSPPAMFSTMMSDGANPYYFVDRYDIEIRPTEKRVPGAPDFGGYQYRFRSQAGRNNYLTDQLIMAIAGTGRGFNDYFNAAVMEGLIEVPEGTNLGYQGELQKPFLSPGLDYLFLKGRPVRIPKDLEIEYRALKETERRLIEKRKIFEK